MQYAYPKYCGDFRRETLLDGCQIAARLVAEEGIAVHHDAFLDAVRGRPGVTVSAQRVRFDRRRVQAELDAWLDATRAQLEAGKKATAGPPPAWQVSAGGVSMNVRDAETDAVRAATTEDLRAGIRLAESYGIGGIYPVAPQDLPPLMRAVACFKICYESSELVWPYDYLDIRQTPFLYDMHQLMGQPFTVTLVVPQPLRIDENDLEVFLRFHERWQAGADIRFQVLDYAMLGISKPISAVGCFTMNLANTLAMRMLFKAFDPAIELGLRGQVGHPVDFRAACWAWGHPRRHIYHWLAARALPVLCGVEVNAYRLSGALLESSSCAADLQTGMERMASCLLPALQGARHFTGAGNLCVDDLYSPVQLVLDVEIVRYVRETLEAFTPHPDTFEITGLYELCRDCARGDALFLAHPDTAAKARTLLPSEGLIRREKLGAWEAHGTLLKDRARTEALERMRKPLEFRLPADKQKELDRIYQRAEQTLAGDS